MVAKQNKIFPEGDLRQNRMYIENFDDFKTELGLTNVDVDGLNAIKLLIDALNAKIPLVNFSESNTITWVTATHSTSEGDISALFTSSIAVTTKRKYSIYLDLSNIASDAATYTVCTVRLKVKVDGTNYRTIATLVTDKALLAIKPVIGLEVPAIAQSVQITLQFDTALAQNQTIAYHYVKESLE